MGKKAIAILCAAAVLLACAVGFWLYTDHHRRTYITINGTEYLRETTELDLSGTDAPELDKLTGLSSLQRLDLRNTGITVPEYEALRQALPQCEILWSVPFQGGYADSDATSLTVQTLSEEDIRMLRYLPGLAQIDASACRDYDALLQLQEARPECAVLYDICLDGSFFPRDASALTLSSTTPQELEHLLPHFSSLESVTWQGLRSDLDELFGLAERYPQIAFSWDMDICGATVNSLSEEVDISGNTVEDLAALEALVTRMPNVRKVIMCGCGFSNEEMEALNNRHEDVLFVWTVMLGRQELRTDLTYFVPGDYSLWLTSDKWSNLRYFTELICLDMGHNSVDNCDFVAYMPKLKYLILADTRVSDLTPLTGLQELVYLEIFLTGVTDYSPILTLPNLEVLNISYTYGQIDVIAQLTWVDHIRWITTKDRALFNSQIAYMQEHLPNTLLETGFNLSSTGGEWRKTQQYRDMRDVLGRDYMEG